MSGLWLVFADPVLRTPAAFGWLAAFYVAPLAVAVLRTSGHRWIGQLDQPGFQRGRSHGI